VAEIEAPRVMTQGDRGTSASGPLAGS